MLYSAIKFFFFFWSCGMGCGILVPNQGSNWCPLYREWRILTTGLPGESQHFEFWQMYNVIYTPLNIIQNNFTTLIIPWAHLFISPHPTLHEPLTTTDLFTVSFAFSRMSYSWNYVYAAFSHWLLSVSNMNWSLLNAFSWTDCSFLFIAK